MKRFMLYSIFPFVLSMNNVSYAQECNHQITGKVINEETKEPVAYANIFLKEAGKGTTTDEHGVYTISKVCDGRYTIECSHISCDHLLSDIEIYADTKLDFELYHEAVELNKIVVKEKASALEQTQANSELLADKVVQGQSLGASLEKITGVTTLKTGYSITKPVIQGLHSNRILVLNNGVRQEGQQWGTEHAPEIDPFIAEKFAVIKGAAGVRYGSEAIGGVVLVEPKSLPTQKGIAGAVNLVGNTNGRQGIVSAMIEGRLSDRIPLSGRLQGTLKRGGNVKSPNYFLANTGMEEYNFSYAVAYQKEAWGTEIFYSQFNSNLGIFAGAHIGNLTDLLNAVEAVRPNVESDFTYDLGRPLQHVEHELFKSKSYLKTGKIGKLSLTYARQYNLRQEFDAHRNFGTLSEELNDPEIQFKTTTHTADLVWSHKPIKFVRGEMGIQYMQQTSKMDRGGLIPDFDSYSGGVFIIERWKKYPFPLEFEMGFRYDFKRMRVKDVLGVEVKQFDFNNLTGTIGAIYKLNDKLMFKAYAGTAWRAPNINELFSNGVHHGAASFEAGRSDLKVEQAINTSLSFRYSDSKLSIEWSPYFKYINDYIYLQPEAEPTLTIRGAFPTFSYQQADARMLGFDLDINYQLTNQLQWQSQTAILRARNLEADDYLALMPADQLTNTLRYSFDKKTDRNFIAISLRNVFKQNRIPEGGDIAAAPAAYHLVDFESGIEFQFAKQKMRMGLSINNVFDVTYRDYLNRFRYFTDEMGRNISVQLKIPFNNFKK